MFIDRVRIRVKRKIDITVCTNYIVKTINKFINLIYSISGSLVTK